MATDSLLNLTKPASHFCFFPLHLKYRLYVQGGMGEMLVHSVQNT